MQLSLSCVSTGGPRPKPSRARSGHTLGIIQLTLALFLRPKFPNSPKKQSFDPQYSGFHVTVHRSNPPPAIIVAPYGAVLKQSDGMEHGCDCDCHDGPPLVGFCPRVLIVEATTILGSARNLIFQEQSNLGISI